MAQALTFPLLKNKEIIEVMKEIGISITEENLSHPEKDKEQIRSENNKIIFVRNKLAKITQLTEKFWTI
jgi:signal recognition particle subunit SEC65